MHNEPREKLRELIIQYGRCLCDDPRRCEALLKDYCGQYKREIFALVTAQKNRVAEDLLKASSGMPQSVIVARLIKRLEDELGLAENVAHWAVESWALALGVIQQPLPPIKAVPAPLPTVKPVMVPPQPLLKKTNPQPMSSVQSPEITEGFGFIATTTPILPRQLPKTTAPVAATVISPPNTANNLLAGRYRDNGNGTVTDVQTGLQWMRFSLGQEWKCGVCIGHAKTYTWQQSLDEAKALNQKSGYANHRDWRIPTKEELLTLVYCSSGQPKIWNDTGIMCQGKFGHPTIDQQAFPNTPTFGCYWSSSANISSVSDMWIVDFYDGRIQYKSAISYSSYVRLVRGKSSTTAVVRPQKPFTIPKSVKPTVSFSNNEFFVFTLKFLIFLIINPVFGLGLALVIYVIFLIGYKLIFNAFK